MLVLIDESGDPGFKLDQGSTSHFVVAMVIFTDFEVAERCSAAIRELRKSLGITSEFKFSKTSRRIRDEFFMRISQYDFQVRALVVDKKKVYSLNLKTDDSRFYNFFVRSLLKYDNGCLKNASVKIDGSGDREFKQQLSNYLKKELCAHSIKKFRFADSRKDDLIQLADMVVGAIARSYREDGDRTDAARWRQALRPRLRDVWEFE